LELYREDVQHTLINFAIKEEETRDSCGRTQLQFCISEKHHEEWVGRNVVKNEVLSWYSFGENE
jgi:hypothetical protein